MARLILIFISVFLMVTSAHAWEGHGGGHGGGWGGGGGWHGGGGHDWHGGGWGGHGGGWGGPRWGGYGGGGIGGGIVGGLIGGAITSLWRQPDPVVVVQPDPLAYCAQRFRSWDPYSHTYLGYDGLRHGCP